jgi:hypothetical protein
MPTLHRELVLPGLDSLVNRQEIDAVAMGDGTYKLTFIVQSESMAMLVQTIRMISLVSDRIYKEVDRAAIHERSDNLVSHLREDEQAVALFYWQLRDKGYKHRKAVQITHGDCPTVKNRSFSKADIWHFVKCYPREQVCLPERNELEVVV